MGNSDRIREDVGLTVRVEQDGEALVIRPVGELDLSNTQTLDAGNTKGDQGQRVGSDSRPRRAEFHGFRWPAAVGLGDRAFTGQWRPTPHAARIGTG